MECVLGLAWFLFGGLVGIGFIIGYVVGYRKGRDRELQRYAKEREQDSTK